MKILVTGGAGFIGSHIVDNLIKKGHKVVVIDNLSSGTKKNLSPKAKFYKMDIIDKKLSKIFQKEKPEVIFHLAAQIDARGSVKNPFFDAKTNILGFLNILQNCLHFGKIWGKSPKIIFSSTGGALYGETKNIPTPENHPIVSESAYGLTKKTTEEYLSLYHRLYNLDFISLRYANVYGPRQNSSGEAGVIAIFLNKLLKGEPITIHGSGEITRDYIYVEDVVRANLLALKNDTSSWKLEKRLINIGTGREVDMNNLCKTIFDVTGKTTKVIYGPKKQGDINRSALDASKAKKLLGWQPKHDLVMGVRKTAKWFIDN
jgi:UDP-glucose 4-epimerase